MTSTTTPLPWQGFDHVALATPDLEATIRFYCDVLGMQGRPSLPSDKPHARTAQSCRSRYESRHSVRKRAMSLAVHRSRSEVRHQVLLVTGKASPMGQVYCSPSVV